MFKPRRNPYQKERRRFFQPLLILLAIPLSLIVLELLTRAIATVAGQNKVLEAYDGDTPKISAYRLKFLDRAQSPYDGLPNNGRLVAKRHIGVGYQLAPNQNSDFWRINEQGFRDEQSIPQTKPNDEIRVFVLGGSTAFGQMSSNNQTTFASKLEARLNQRVAEQKANPDKFRPDPLPVYRPERIKALALPPMLRSGRYRVINAAVPGYTSGNELGRLAIQVLPYKPDLIILIDGYADLMLPSNESESDVPHLETFLSDAPNHLLTHLSQETKQLVSQAYLLKAINYWLLRPNPSTNQLSLVASETAVPLGKQLAADPAELKRRRERYKNNLMQIGYLTSSAQIPLIVAIQPEVSGRNQSKLSLDERSLIKQLDANYTQRIQAGYTELAQVNQQLQQTFPNNVSTLNLQKLFYNFPSQAFYDTIHLTDEANTVLADQLYKTILDLPQFQPAPPKQPQ